MHFTTKAIILSIQKKFKFSKNSSIHKRRRKKKLNIKEKVPDFQHQSNIQ